MIAPFDWRVNPPEEWTARKVKTIYRRYLRDVERSIYFEGTGYSANTGKPAVWVKVGPDHTLVGVRCGPGWKIDGSDAPPDWVCAGRADAAVRVYLHPRKRVVRFEPWHAPPGLLVSEDWVKAVNRGIVAWCEEGAWSKAAGALNCARSAIGKALPWLEKLVLASEHGGDEGFESTRKEVRGLMLRSYVGE